MRNRVTDAEEAEHLAHAAESSLRHLAVGLFAAVALVAFLDLAPVVVWSGASTGLWAALGSVGVVVLLLAVPFLGVLAASWSGVSLLVGASQVIDLVERRALARVEARMLRSRQGAVVVPAAVPQGNGDEVSADAGSTSVAPRSGARPSGQRRHWLLQRIADQSVRR